MRSQRGFGWPAAWDDAIPQARNSPVLKALFLLRSSSEAAYALSMRIRITRQLIGSIDGIQLGRFIVGELYVVGTALGSYLLALGAAEPVIDESPALITPIGERLARPPASLTRAGVTSPAVLDRAADRAPRRRKPSS